MKSLVYFAIASALLSGLYSCVKEATPPPEDGERGSIVLNVSMENGVKSSIIADENRVFDMNIWIYGGDGSLRDSRFVSDSPFSGSASMTLPVTVSSGDMVVVLANAGVAVAAPPSASTPVSGTRDYTASAIVSQGVLAVGSGTFAGDAGFTRSASVSLSRVMSKLSVSMALGGAFPAQGAVLGSNIRLVSARLRGASRVWAFNPSFAAVSAQTFRAVSASQLGDYEYLSDADMASLSAGGTVSLYCLPNYAGDAWNASYGNPLATYLEMTFDCDAVGPWSAGRIVCRFYVNDGTVVGAYGGNAYTASVRLTDDGMPVSSWRKENYCFDIPSGDFTPGIAKAVLFHGPRQGTPGVDYSYSLSASAASADDGRFRILSGDGDGVTLVCISPGSSTLYCRDASGTVLSHVSLSGVWPTVTLGPVDGLDILGKEKSIPMTGAPVASQMFDWDGSASAYWNDTYAFADTPVTGVTHSNSYNPDTFLGATGSGFGASLFVKDLSSKSVRDYKSWRDNTYSYRLNFRGGFSSQYGTVQVVDANVEPYAGNKPIYPKYNGNEMGGFADVSAITSTGRRKPSWGPRYITANPSALSTSLLEIKSGMSSTSQSFDTRAGTELRSSGGSSLSSIGYGYYIRVGSVTLGSPSRSADRSSFTVSAGYNELRTGGGVFLQGRNGHSGEFAEESIGEYVIYTYRLDNVPMVFAMEVTDLYYDGSYTYVFVERESGTCTWDFSGCYFREDALVPARGFDSFAMGSLSFGESCPDFSRNENRGTNLPYAHMCFDFGDNVSGRNSGKYAANADMWLIGISTTANQAVQGGDMPTGLTSNLNYSIGMMESRHVLTPASSFSASLANVVDGPWTYRTVVNSAANSNGTGEYGYPSYLPTGSRVITVGPWDCLTSWSWGSLSESRARNYIPVYGWDVPHVTRNSW